MKLSACRLFCCGFVLIASSGTAEAQSPTEISRAHFEAGIAAVEAEDWVTAERELSLSIEARQTAPALYQLALACDHLGQLRRAVAALRTVTVEMQGGLSEAQLADAVRYQAELEQALPRVTVRSEGATVEIVVDGEPEGAAVQGRPTVFELDPGGHTVLARFRDQVLLESDLTLARADEANLVVPEPPVEAIFEDPEPDSSGVHWGVWAGISVALAAAGGVVLALFLLDDSSGRSVGDDPFNNIVQVLESPSGGAHFGNP